MAAGHPQIIADLRSSQNFTTDGHFYRYWVSCLVLTLSLIVSSLSGKKVQSCFFCTVRVGTKTTCLILAGRCILALPCLVQEERSSKVECRVFFAALQKAYWTRPI